MHSKRLGLACGAVAVVAGALLGAFRGPGDFAVSDMRGYQLAAEQLLRGEVPLHPPLQARGVSFLIVAATQWLGDPSRVAWVHLACAAAGVVATIRLAQYLGSSRQATIIVGVLSATWLPTAMYTQLYLNECVAAALTTIALATWVGLFSLTRPVAPLPAAIAGTALGLACLFRPNLQLTAALAIAWGVLRGHRSSALTFALGTGVSLAFAYGITRMAYPSSSGLASGAGFNFYMAMAPIRQLSSTTAGGGWAPIVNVMLYPEDAGVITAASLHDNQHFFGQAWDLACEDPGGVLWRWLTNLVYSTGYAGMFPGLWGSAALRPFTVVTALAAAIVALRLPSSGQEARALGGVVLASVFVTCTFFMGTPRARYPFDLVLLAAAAPHMERLGRHALERVRWDLTARRSRIPPRAKTPPMDPERRSGGRYASGKP